MPVINIEYERKFGPGYSAEYAAEMESAESEYSVFGRNQNFGFLPMFRRFFIAEFLFRAK